MATRLFDYVFYNDFYSKVKSNINEADLNQENAMPNIYQSDYFQQECLYLVALTCYFLSCKFWERFPPKVRTILNVIKS
jgi:hypothetical protein